MELLTREKLIEIWQSINGSISGPELVDSIIHYLSKIDESKWKFLLSDRMQLRIVMCNFVMNACNDYF